MVLEIMPSKTLAPHSDPREDRSNEKRQMPLQRLPRRRTVFILESGAHTISEYHRTHVLPYL